MDRLFSAVTHSRLSDSDSNDEECHEGDQSDAGLHEPG